MSSNAPPHIIEALSRANNGDTEAARELLQDFVGSVRSPDRLKLSLPPAPHAEILHYLAECIEQILGGVPAEKALGLTADSSGRHAHRDRERNILIWIRMTELQSEGLSLRAAGRQVVDEQSLPFSGRRAEQIYNEVDIWYDRAKENNPEN